MMVCPQNHRISCMQAWRERAAMIFWCLYLNFTCNLGPEEQAIDRVRRIGQTRPVRAVRYICSDTVEQKILPSGFGTAPFAC